MSENLKEKTERVQERAWLFWATKVHLNEKPTDIDAKYCDDNFIFISSTYDMK